MSHDATNWAIKQRGLDPATKLLLWQLADRHNKDTGRCDPSQERLAADCEMSRASINRHLAKLEEAGLIRRFQRIDPRTKRQESTTYQLAFDTEFTASQNETRAVSQIDPDPCLKYGDSRVSICDTNPVREPGRKPACDAREVSDAEFEAFWQACAHPRDRAKTRKLYAKAVEQGTDPAWLLAAAKRHCKENADVPRIYVIRSDNWLDQKAWLATGCAAVEQPEVDGVEALARAMAERINAGKRVYSLSDNVRQKMLDLKLVTTEELKRLEVR